MTRKPAEPDTRSPYLAARQEWNERYGSYISQARQWKAVAFACIGITGLVIVGLLYQATRSRYIPFVVEVDKLGRPMPVAPAVQAQAVDPRIMKAGLAAFVANTRTVTADATLQRESIEKAYAHLSQGDAATTTLSEHFNKPANNPFNRAATETVTIEINSVLPITKDTWQVEWTETVRTRRGQTKESSPWKATATVYVVPPTREAQILKNPLGIFIREFTWAKQL